jgi:hypothetical protein
MTRDAGYIADTTQQGVERLTAKRRTPRVVQIVQAVTRPLQALEDLQLDLRGALLLDTATGGWLDRLGRIVGEPREGATDQDYRRFIRARLLINASEGGIAQVIRIAELLTDTGVVQYSDAFPAGYGLLLVTSAPPSATLQARIRDRVERATASGVGVSLVAGGPSLDTIFRLDLSAMPDAGDPGDGMPLAF